ncbi:unnamed protein product (macronuclear) [Paramecium tetraurelia]|uniref:BolA-like protein n=1 Tax=Paramecium tetraurelia TaxID=5888 RepID=A0C4W0_PARTE|nr:uncharacterized protein GSPATT00006326001 [Paramecium tetraurelia]CAK65827.1 unnamed protein product [Paramecium tetraurelia]|eukprot:XP_001433224.1 hypothetical protein (macronuclear) [Paramecium tetraurelia strain d4-2]
MNQIKYSFCTVRNLLLQKLTSDFTPQHLSIINESNLHSVPKGSETHFKITIVSNEFENKSHIQRHRSIYQSIDNLKNDYKIHAIQITAKTSNEWQQSTEVNPTPSCRGGSKVKSS